MGPMLCTEPVMVSPCLALHLQRAVAMCTGCRVLHCIECCCKSPKRGPVAHASGLFKEMVWASAGQIWPYLDNAVSAVARAKLEPKLKERRAAWMADISVEQCAPSS